MLHYQAPMMGLLERPLGISGELRGLRVFRIVYWGPDSSRGGRLEGSFQGLLWPQALPEGPTVLFCV